MTDKKTQSTACYHIKAKRILNRLRGAFTFVLCERCGEKVYYNRKPWTPQTHRMVFYCNKCYSRGTYIVNDLDKYPANSWICPGCGTEREIIYDKVVK